MYIYIYLTCKCICIYTYFIVCTLGTSALLFYCDPCFVQFSKVASHIHELALGSIAFSPFLSPRLVVLGKTIAFSTKIHLHVESRKHHSHWNNAERVLKFTPTRAAKLCKYSITVIYGDLDSN